MTAVYFHRFWPSDLDLIKIGRRKTESCRSYLCSKVAVKNQPNILMTIEHEFSVTNNKLQNLEFWFGQFLTFRAGQKIF